MLESGNEATLPSASCQAAWLLAELGGGCGDEGAGPEAAATLALGAIPPTATLPSASCQATWQLAASQELGGGGGGNGGPSHATLAPDALLPTQSTLLAPCGMTWRLAGSSASTELGPEPSRSTATALPRGSGGRGPPAEARLLPDASPGQGTATPCQSVVEADGAQAGEEPAQREPLLGGGSQDRRIHCTPPALEHLDTPPTSSSGSPSSEALVRAPRTAGIGGPRRTLSRGRLEQLDVQLAASLAVKDKRAGQCTQHVLERLDTPPTPSTGSPSSVAPAPPSRVAGGAGASRGHSNGQVENLDLHLAATLAAKAEAATGSGSTESTGRSTGGRSAARSLSRGGSGGPPPATSCSPLHAGGGSSHPQQQLPLQGRAGSLLAAAGGRMLPDRAQSFSAPSFVRSTARCASTGAGATAAGPPVGLRTVTAGGMPGSVSWRGRPSLARAGTRDLCKEAARPAEPLPHGPVLAGRSRR